MDCKKRYQIAASLELEIPISDIVKTIKYHRISVHREPKRYCDNGFYYPKLFKFYRRMIVIEQANTKYPQIKNISCIC
ncbi:hypothetical protein [Candidatus Enterovibrio escicola]|uniref:hypothetical protein n=1 Tax=Candidatus Enterovibrio escicola TaxID=1927127 RepID=UPI001237C22B